ncbi:MAG TPA: YolD-like family protein [Bacilli bacterium]
MSKKLQKNGLFESSRMILPEHREAYISQQLHINKEIRPELDPDEIATFSRLIAESLETGLTIRLTLFAEYGKKTITGKASKIDRVAEKLKIIGDDGPCWVWLRDIIAVND